MSVDPASVPEIIAHRGYSSRAPENTLAAMDAALEAGARALEWDVQIASCGTPVLFHDVHLGRTSNGVGPVRRRTLGQLQALDAGRWFSPEFEGERIPSLAEALAHVAGRVGRIYTEIKGYREMEDLDRIVQVTRDSGLMDQTVFISLDWITLDRVTSQAPGHPIGYVADDPDRILAAVARASAHGAAFVDAKAEVLLADPSTAADVRGAGLDLGVWTVDDPGQAQRLLDEGVTRFTTNEVAALLGWRDRG
jgi:glycerophosphoryl diester phosphodiesterase